MPSRWCHARLHVASKYGDNDHERQMGFTTTAKIHIEQAVAGIVQVTPAPDDHMLIQHFARGLISRLLQEKVRTDAIRCERDLETRYVSPPVPIL
eukprot:6241125-Pyramimonas_sp.AAC.1